MVDSYFQIGLCASYDRVLQVPKGIGDNLVKQFKSHGVFAPGEMKRSVAKIDHNATSSTAKKHFHGTSMTIMQYPTQSNTGTDISNEIENEDSCAFSYE